MATTMLYQGHGSVRITTDQNHVIYLDPYAGEGYDLPADLILVTHQHFDHNQIRLVENRTHDCQILTEKDMMINGNYQTVQLDFVKVEAVAAYNSKHPVGSGVGYILTFKDGVQVYFTGDTSTTDTMPQLADRCLDYAFFCSDGMANMSMEEAASCARAVGARHSIPYHTGIGTLYDEEAVKRFDVPGRLLLRPGQTIEFRAK